MKSTIIEYDNIAGHEEEGSDEDHSVQPITSDGRLHFDRSSVMIGYIFVMIGYILTDHQKCSVISVKSTIIEYDIAGQ